MILYDITHNTAVRALPQISSTRRPEGFLFNNATGQIRYVLPDDRGVLLCLDVCLHDIDNQYAYALFDQPDNDWQRDPDTGQRLRYRSLHPVEYVFD